MTDIVDRPFRQDDRAQVLNLLAETIGWLPDEHHAAYFEWKHQRNPFGPSPAWVAVSGEHVVGFRAFLRWEFECDGEIIRAVRAVDTATHPDHRGAGIFTRLTLQGLDALREDGVDFVFNTPNSQSLPGYLKMGWDKLGRVGVLARPRTPLSVVRMAASRTPAELWSLPSGAGVPARQALSDVTALESLVGSQPATPFLRTRRSAEYLAWRYGGFDALSYRCVLAGRSPADGLAMFRVRRRGRAVEATIGDIIVPGGDSRLAARLAHIVLSETRADYALRCGPLDELRSGFLPVPGAGPTLTWRQVCSSQRPVMGAWRLTLGDVELF